MPATKTLESPRSMLKGLRRIPATLILIVVNLAAFVFTYLQAGTLDGSRWAITLLRVGAQFNPLTLENEWYRIFTHMFLHGGLLHLAVNMYALFAVGSGLEPLVGTRKFLAVYLVTGVAAALNSLYWNLFSIGVGASGAIFGVFGFSLMISIFFSRKTPKSLAPVLINFTFFVGINLLIGESVNADNAAHFGGLCAGIVIGLYSLAQRGGHAFRKINIEYLMIPLFFLTFFALPRYQVSYYKFFQHVIAAEDSTKHRMGNGHTNDQYLKAFIKNIDQWDATLARLNRQTNVPEKLAKDTFNLRRYINLRKQENVFRKAVVQRESYVYLDSVEYVQEIIPQYLELQYSLNFRLNDNAESARSDSASRKMVKVLYDSDWIETTSAAAVYYRIGPKDSLGRWNGAVRDYYNNGTIQMKGAYKDDKRDGVFRYYSDHRTYTSVGLYRDDKSFGKWETFHDNGKIESEIFFNNSYFLKSLWDSIGNQLVIDGNGRDMRRYPDGVIATEGEYRYGLKEGYWYGRHPTGEMYYEENYNRGRLISGQSRTLDGETFIYDATSLLPMPQDGYEKFEEYVKSETKKFATDDLGHVKLSFRVTKKGVIADLRFEQHATPALDQKAKKILLDGPRWLSARKHGHEAVDGWTVITIEFY
jgi:membrane associated rhomboid family serine protease/antitoxin component YwqK of YwqJK toxin-antitoxin module